MLYGLKGEPVRNLHTGVLPGTLGARPGGIFSNPMFVGRLASSMKYGVVYNEPDEIAGYDSLTP